MPHSLSGEPAAVRDRGALMIGRAAFLVAFLVAPSAAQDRVQWGLGESWIELVPTDEGAVVRFKNEVVQVGDEIFDLTAGGITAGIALDYGQGTVPDLLTVTPPAIHAPDGATTDVRLVPLVGLEMM